MLAQTTFEWTGGDDGTGYYMFSSDGYTNWRDALDEPLVAGDLDAGSANDFNISTRVGGGPDDLIGAGIFLTLANSDTYIRSLSFKNADDLFPEPFILVGRDSGGTFTRIHFTEPDTTIISLDDTVTGVVQMGNATLSETNTLIRTNGDFSLRLPASGVSTFHVENESATLDFRGATNNQSGYGAIHAGSETVANLNMARIRKTGDGTLDLRTVDGQGNRVLGTIIEGGTVIIGNATHLGMAPADPMADFLVINGGTLQLNSVPVALASNRGVQIGENGSVFQVLNTSAGFSGVIADMPDQEGTLVKTGGLILTLTNANTYTGGTRIEEGRISFNNSGAFGSGPITLGENTGLGATATSTTVENNIVFEGSVARFGMGSFLNTLNGELDLAGGTRTFRLINSLVHNSTISNGSIILQSDLNNQRLELNGSNSYEGTTTVDRGRLIVNGEITSNVTVTRGVTDELAIGALGGSGFVSGAVTIGGELRPGPNTASDPGTLQIAGALTLSDSSEAIFEILDESTADKITDLTSISLDGILTVSLLSGYEPSVGASFDLIDSAATPVLGPNFSFNLPALPAGRAWETSSFATSGTLAVIASAATPYDTWASSFSLVGNDALPTSDPDSDGFTNAQEFAFGTDPSKSNGSLVSIEKSGSSVTVTYIERNSDVNYVVQSSATLTPPWNPAAGIVYLDPVDQTGVPAGYTRKQFTSPLGTRDFFRVESTLSSN